MSLYHARWLLILAFFPGLIPGFLIPGGTLCAAVGPEKSETRLIWDEGITYLLTMLTDKETAVDVSKVSGLLDFALAEKGVEARMKPAERENATGAYFFTDVKAPLSKVVKYAYNPKIPAYLTLPSVVRLGGWQVKPYGTVANFWDKIGEVKSPLLMRGVEYEEITPDMTTGAYDGSYDDPASLPGKGFFHFRDPSEKSLHRRPERGNHRPGHGLELFLFRPKRSDENRPRLGELLYVRRFLGHPSIRAGRIQNTDPLYGL
jgi:hypothetical protein